MVYLSGPPARFAAHFDLLIAGRRVPQDRWYVFDGVWLVEKVADQEPKTFRKWQIVVAPDAKPEQANPLALGGGPFVIPVNMKKDLVLRRFAATLVAPNAKADPAGSVHLHLIPKPGQRSQVSEIDLWYDSQSLLPLRVKPSTRTQRTSP